MWACVGRVYASPPADSAFRAREELALPQLEDAVRAAFPDLEVARRNLSEARARSQQARLFENPVLEAGWGTLPVGRTNPRDLERPYANVPNYSVGLSYTIPVAKRTPRIAQADAERRAEEARLELITKDAALLLADTLGDLANAQLREQGLRELGVNAQRAVQLAEARLAADFGAPLEVDRLRIEVERTEQQAYAMRGAIHEALARCGALVGSPCVPFASAEEARRYLDAWVARVEELHSDLSQRPDLRALSAEASARRAEQKLAEAQAIPDPTVRLGYLHDRFLISGNQLNSLNVNLSVPLPVFDHGQARQAGARLARQHLETERTQRVIATQASLGHLRDLVASQEARCMRVRNETMPRARQVLSELESASEARLIPLTDVIQARRAVAELFVEEANSCADAYAAALRVYRALSASGEQS